MHNSLGTVGNPPNQGCFQETWLLLVMMCEGYFLNIVREHLSERCVSVSSFLFILLKAKETEYLLPFIYTTILEYSNENFVEFFI